VISTLDIKN